MKTNVSLSLSKTFVNLDAHILYNFLKIRLNPSNFLRSMQSFFFVTNPLFAFQFLLLQSGLCIVNTISIRQVFS